MEADLFFLPWLVTYALHSTILLGGAWLVTRFVAARDEGFGEALWKLALVGGIVTSTLQVGLDLRPLTGNLIQFERAGPALETEAVSTPIPMNEPRRVAFFEPVSDAIASVPTVRDLDDERRERALETLGRFRSDFAAGRLTRSGT